MEFIYSESVPIRKVDNTPLSEDEFYKVLNLAHEAIQCARKQREEVLASCAALRARIEDVEKLRVVIKHDAWMITSHDDPFILYQQGNMSKGKLCEYIAKAVCAYLKEG
jgi:hypothetical protein